MPTNKSSKDEIKYLNKEDKTKLMLEIENQYNEKIEDLLFRLYWEEEKSTIQIGRELPIARSTVQNWMKRLSISIRHQDAVNHQIAYLLQEIEEKFGEDIKDILFRLYWKEKKSFRDIGKELGTYPATVWKWMKKLSIPRRDQHFRYKKTRLMQKIEKKFNEDIENLLNRLYWEKETNATEIDDILEIGEGTSIGWMNKLDIPRRDNSQATILKWQDNDWRTRITNSFNSDKCRQLKRKAMKEKWDDDEYVEKILSAMGQSPNNLETFVDNITPDNLRFVGDGSCWRWLPSLGKHKNPDFKITGENKVIEVYGDYWHKDDNPQKIIDAFAEIGIECIIIWEHEIYDDLENTLGRIARFIGQKDWQLSLF